MSRRLPWRTVVASRDTGRFTPEQLEQAVLSVMRQAEHGRAGGPMILREPEATYGSPAAGQPSARAGRPMVMRDQGPAFGSPLPAQSPTTGPAPDASGPAAERGTSAQRRRTRRKGAAGEP